MSLEATGTYSLDVALALDAAEGIEVAVLNPKTVSRFAETLRRSKTDAADAAGAGRVQPQDGVRGLEKAQRRGAGAACA